MKLPLVDKLLIFLQLQTAPDTIKYYFFDLKLFVRQYRCYDYDNFSAEWILGVILQKYLDKFSLLPLEPEKYN